MQHTSQAYCGYFLHISIACGGEFCTQATSITFISPLSNVGLEIYLSILVLLTLFDCNCCCCVASVVSDSVRPHRRQPTRLPVPGILQARTLEWVAIAFSNAWKWSRFSHVRLLKTPWTAAYQAPPSMGFSRQEYWSRVPSPSTWLQILLLLASCLNSQCWQLQM